MSRTWREERGEETRQPKTYCQSLPPLDDFLWDEARAYLRERDLDPALAARNGWYPSRRAGDNIHRLVIPATSGVLENKYWQARAMLKGEVPADVKRWQSPANSRGDALIITWPVAEARGAALVEGPVDALAASQSGLFAVALMGMAPPAAALEFLIRLIKKWTPLFVVWDSDEPEPWLEIIKYLWGKGVTTSLVDPYPAKDLAALPSYKRDKLFSERWG